MKLRAVLSFTHHAKVPPSTNNAPRARATRLRGILRAILWVKSPEVAAATLPAIVATATCQNRWPFGCNKKPVVRKRQVLRHFVAVYVPEKT